jgi:hypothetical protein
VKSTFRPSSLDKATAYANILEQAGRLTRDEANLVKQEVLRQQHQGMTTEEWTELRQSKGWPSFERAMRAMPDSADWREHDAARDAASRKLVAHVLSDAYYYGGDAAVDTAEYLEAMRDTVQLRDVTMKSLPRWRLLSAC